MSILTEDVSEVKRLSTASTFDLWAEVYDAQINPFLSLEERVVSALLPELEGLDALAGDANERVLGLHHTDRVDEGLEIALERSRVGVKRA